MKKKNKKNMGNNILTSFDNFINEEFWPFRKNKELTPDEEYQKQKRQQEKEWERIVKKAKDKEPKITDPNDPYGEELSPEAEKAVAKQMKAQADYYERTGKYPQKYAKNYSNSSSSSSGRSSKRRRKWYRT